MRKRSTENFDLIYADHAQRVYGFLSYRTGDPSLAEDLLADTFERAFRARERYDSDRGAAWLYTIALNVMRDNARRRANEVKALARAAETVPPAPQSPLEQLETREEVMRSLDALSPEEREAVALRYGADLSMPEIASATGEPLTTIEGRVYRSLRKLRAELT
jgi:RNA polymerase sigma-70 factor (ECF subfamily)